MTIYNFRKLGLGSIFSVAGFGLALLLSAHSPADALSNKFTILTGGFNQGQNISTVYTAPGLTAAFNPDYPDTGEGEGAVQLRMHQGELSYLRVKLVTQNIPSGGSLVVTVRINGADTALTCTLTASGNCGTGKSTKVAISKNDKLAIEIDSDLADEGNFVLTYTLLFD